MSGKKNGYGAGTFVDSKLFLSPAFFSLGQRGTSPTVSNCSAQVLILFLGKRQFGYRKRKGVKVLERTDDNKFTMTYKELDSFGISQQRATRSIDELLAKGFIEIVNPGGLYDQDKAVYSLLEDYRLWRKGDAPIRQRKRDVRRGFQGQCLGATARPENKNRTRRQGTPTHAPTGDTHTKDTHVDKGHPENIEIEVKA